MQRPGMFLFLFIQIIVLTSALQKACKKPSSAEVVYAFTVLDYDFGSDERRQEALDSKEFIPINNFFARIESYKNVVYLTTPRLFSGVPATLVRVVETSGQPLLQPFPDLESQQLGDCDKFQQVFSFNIDPNTGIMWLIDGGHVIMPNEDDPFRNSFCPASLVALRVNDKRRILKHEFPESVVAARTNFLDDLVLDYVDGKVAYVYISDSVLNILVVYDVKRDRSFSISHPSLQPDPTASPVNIGPRPFISALGVNGVAMSCDFRFLYYQSLTGFDFFRIPTSVLRNGGEEFDAKFELLGRRNYLVDGMTYSTKHNLYFGVASEAAIDRWLVGFDARRQGGFREARLKSVQRIAQDDERLEFPDSVSINERGVLYFSPARVNRLIGGFLDITGRDGNNFHIWRKKLGHGERSYLWRAKQRTAIWRRTASPRCDRLY